MDDVHRLTLIELVKALSTRKLSPVTLMDAVLDRIDTTHADLNAVVALYDRDRLRRDAQAAEQRIAQGTARPLEGVPLGVKDLEDAEGLITRSSSSE